MQENVSGSDLIRRSLSNEGHTSMDRFYEQYIEKSLRIPGMRAVLKRLDKYTGSARRNQLANANFTRRRPSQDT